jgi:hypothetical protein
MHDIMNEGITFGAEAVMAVGAPIAANGADTFTDVHVRRYGCRKGPCASLASGGILGVIKSSSTRSLI